MEYSNIINYLMFFSDNSNMYVSSSWVSMNHFFPLYFPVSLDAALLWESGIVN